MPTNSYTAVVEKEGNLYAALCPELVVTWHCERRLL